MCIVYVTTVFCFSVFGYIYYSGVMKHAVILISAN